jgi:hypothetical protein
MCPNTLPCGIPLVTPWLMDSAPFTDTFCFLSVRHVDAEAYLFTDDTKVYKEIKTQTDTTSLQKDLDNLHEWSDKWLLKFHPNKCKVMTASNKRGNNREQKYHLYDSEGKEIELQNSDGEKDIGVLVDDQLNYSQHIQLAYH